MRAIRTRRYHCLYRGDYEADIEKRLTQFFNTACLEKDADKKESQHSGGWTFKEKAGGAKWKTENLYYAVFACEESDGNAVFIKYVERFAIWEFFEKNNGKPACNSA